MFQAQLLMLSMIISSTTLKTTQQPKKPLNYSSVILRMGYGDHHFGPEIKIHLKHFHKGSEEVQRMGQTLIQIVSVASRNEQLRNSANSGAALDKLLQ